MQKVAVLCARCTDFFRLRLDDHPTMLMCLYCVENVKREEKPHFLHFLLSFVISHLQLLNILRRAIRRLVLKSQTRHGPSQVQCLYETHFNCGSSLLRFEVQPKFLSTIRMHAWVPWPDHDSQVTAAGPALAAVRSHAQSTSRRAVEESLKGRRRNM